MMTSASEVWKDIPGFTGFYKSSNFGNIKSLDRQFIGRNGRKQSIKRSIKAQWVDRDGYLITRLSFKGSTKLYKVHRLILMSFKPHLCQEILQVNHKDGRKKHNYIHNLEWCSPGYNNKHAVDTGLRKIRYGSDSHLSRYTDSDVQAIIKLLQGDNNYKHIEEKVGMSRSQISNINLGKRWRELSERFVKSYPISKIKHVNQYGGKPREEIKLQKTPKL